MNQTTQRSLCVGGICLVVGGRDSHWVGNPNIRQSGGKRSNTRPAHSASKNVFSRARAGA